MLIDSHAHLTDRRFDADRDAVLARAREVGVETIVTVGAEPSDWEAALELTRRQGDPGIYAALGIHPHEADLLSDEMARRLRGLCRTPRVIAIGEIGLDYHYMNSPREEQQKAFRRQIRLAREEGLPIVVHSREAEGDTVRILREEGPLEAGGVIHCFSGNRAMAREVLDLGFFISFSGSLTFKNAGELRRIAETLPVERLLVETDSPYLAPRPVRGKRNEPSHVRFVAETLADILGLSAEDIGRITRHNVLQLFSIGTPEAEGKIAYRIRDSLYLNITNRCTNACGFCVRNYQDFVKGHNLRLKREPDPGEVIRAIGNPERYREVVFCGYGEPMIRLALLKEAASWVKEHGGRVRVNTNGQGNLIHGRNILPELSGIVDEYSVSLNTENEKKYLSICRPKFGEGTYGAVKSFIREARKGAEVSVTVLNLPEVDVDACREIAEKELRVGFRLRYYDQVG